MKLGNGQVRKGQVLEIAGKKAVVQVSDYSEGVSVNCARSLLRDNAISARLTCNLL